MKKFLTVMMASLMVASFSGCGGESAAPAESAAPTSSAAPAGVSDPEIDPQAEQEVDASTIEILDEKVVMTNELDHVTAVEGENQRSPFVKQGQSVADGTACLYVRMKGEEKDTEIPMDNSVTYTMADDATENSYIEKVEINMTVDGEKQTQEQYRIYINSKQE